MANIEALVMPKDPDKVEEVANLVEKAGGYLKLAFSPHGNIMILPEDKVAEVREHPEVYGVYTQPINDGELAPEDSMEIVPQLFWNAYCGMKVPPR